MRYFAAPLAFAVTAILGAAAYGDLSGGMDRASGYAVIVAALGALELSLSFDNAVVNAKILEDLDTVWRRRFINFGMPVAVFGMRLLFPLLIVAVASSISPVEAARLALADPAQYADALRSAHPAISSFGGAFLLMVALSFFLDVEKDTHWLGWLERHMAKLGQIEGMGIAALVLCVVYTVSRVTALPSLMLPGMFGVVAFAAVESLGNLLSSAEDKAAAIRSGIATLIYLEILDASFSFDGVIGAFAVSTNPIIIALGLGIGAFFVRSITLMMVDRGTLNAYRYLEHGAYWAIMILAAMMFAQTSIDIPDVVTALTGAGVICAAIACSIVRNKFGRNHRFA